MDYLPEKQYGNIPDNSLSGQFKELKNLIQL